MKRAYKKRRATKYNYSALIAMLAVIVMVAVCIAGIVMIIKLAQEKLDDDPKVHPSEENSTDITSSELETTTKEIATGATVPEPSNIAEESVTSGQTTVAPTAAPTAAPTTAPGPADPPAVTDDIPMVPTDFSCFSGAAFVGDSRTGGFFYASHITVAPFYYIVGLQVHEALKPASQTDEKYLIALKDGSKGNIIDALKQGTYNKVFIEIGVNFLTIADNTFINSYTNIVNAVKQVQPQAEIYVLSIIPCTAKFPDSVVNIKRLNNCVKTVVANTGVKLIDLSPVFGNNDALPAGSYNPAGDGYHLDATYNLKILNYIKRVVYNQ